MKLKTAQLIDQLNVLKDTALSWKGILNYSNTLIFTGQKLLSYNDKTAISVDFKTEFQCCVPADPFYKIISGIISDDIILKLKDENNFYISGGKIKASLKTIEIDMSEIIKIMGLSKEQSWNQLPSDFIEGVSLCMFSVSKDLTHRFLTCLCVNENKIISSDNLRLSHYIMMDNVPESFLIPGSVIPELIKLKNVDKYCLFNNWIFFKAKDNIQFCSRIYNDDYPEVSSFFDVEGWCVEFSKDIQNDIKTVAIMANGEFHIEKNIEIVIAENKIMCKGEKEIGWIKSNRDIDYDGDPIQFFINPDFFHHILDKATSATCGNDKILFESGPFKHLISLYTNEDEIE